MEVGEPPADRWRIASAGRLRCVNTVDCVIAKTNAQRQADLKAKRQTSGLVPVTNLWAHPDDVQPIRDHAMKLARRRARLVKASA